MKKTDPEALVEKHHQLTHSEDRRVASHVQRQKEEWWLNTLMLEGIDVPFKYKRQKRYKNLQGARVNLTYYPAVEKVAGFEIDIFRVVRLRRS